MFNQIQDQGFDIVADFEEFQQTFDKSRVPSMGSKRTKQARAESLQISMLNSQKDDTAEHLHEVAKPVLDLTKFK